MIRILIADDHEIFREGLRKIIDGIPDFCIAGESADGQDVLKKLREGNYDVVVLDLKMPGKDWLDVLKEIKREKPKLPVLVLSMYPEERYAVRALTAGASGYVTKTSVSGELINAIRKVLQGKKYISTTLGEQLASTLEANAGKPPHETLSEREFQVMCLIAQGKTVKEIADEIYLSVTTVSTYRSRVLEKMNMKSNAELTRYALENGLID